jgi:hypothetical protein
LIGLGIVAVLLVIIAGLTFVTLRRHGGTHYPRQWDSRVLPIVHFDETERGLLFKHPVEVQFMSPKDFDKAVTSDSGDLSDKDRQQINDTTASFRALGLLEGNIDLFKEENNLSGNGTLAFYNDKDKKVRVKGTELTPDVRVTLAHELTHALQDQHFDLTRLDGLKSDDAQDAMRAVVEGDAVNVENAYVDQMSSADKATYEREQGKDSASAGYDKVPDTLVATFTSPYIVGPPFVEALDAKGGHEAIDEAIQHPPPSTAALYQLYDYLAQLGPSSTPTTAAVPSPKVAAGQKHLEDGDFGATTWYLMLSRRLDPHLAMQAVDGWEGDSSLIYREPSGRVCVTARYQGKTPAATATMTQLLNAWAAAGPATGVKVSRSGDTVQINACDPGTSAKAKGKDQSSADLELLAGRLEFASLLLKEHVPPATAQCASNYIVGQLSPDDVESNNDAVQQKVAQAVTQAAAACR